MNAAPSFIENVAGDYPDYLRDESRCRGRADSISFPKTEEELIRHLSMAREMGLTVTVQGGRTGVTGGAVPKGGHILNLGRMNRVLEVRKDTSLDQMLVSVQPGVLLAEIQKYASEKLNGYFFPPDITETSAAIGGMSACNASGSESFLYGPTRDYINAIRVVLADGDLLELNRGGQKADGRRFSLRTCSGRVIEGQLPEYDMPRVKNAAGYFVKDNMDLMDLFIGSEGTLGIIARIELKLIPCPPVRWGIVAFFPSEASSIRFVKEVRCLKKRPVAIEYFDNRSLQLLRGQKNANPAFKDIPDLSPELYSAVYVEYHGENEEEVESVVEDMSCVMSACGGDEEAAWLASHEHEMQRLREFRHAVPEAVNLLIDKRRETEPDITKLGTDMAVPDDKLEDIMKIYSDGLASAHLEYVIFGHIGNNHVHVNIIPRNMEDYELGKKLYMKWARDVAGMGGTVAAEHGIGKLKSGFLRKMYGEESIKEMLKVKRLFDPDGMINPGNLFGEI